MRARRVALGPGADLSGFRRAVRALIGANVPPGEVLWDVDDVPSLFGDAASTTDAPAISLSRAAASLVGSIVCHCDAQRYAQLYALIWRLLHGERHLLEVHSDPLVNSLDMKRKAVHRDLHKMHAFLRFRRVEDRCEGERFVAWFEPEHYILEAAAPFFVDRFRNLSWSILTPIGSIHWDDSRLAFGPAATRDEAPAGDAFEAGWNAYFESTFNPARLNTPLMRAHMPKKYWRNLPETASIAGLVQTAPSRVRQMIDQEAALPRKRSPDKAVAAMAEAAPRTLAELNAIIARSEPFVAGGTCAVLGEGPSNAEIALVGEQPGDQEDLQGRPFVGPAGQLLDRALAEAGIDRSRTYLTNAVKHFKFEQRGKRRIHQKPTAGEVKHYRWWLDRELEFVQPRIVVALGATAALALAHKTMPIKQSRGPADLCGRTGFITVHPSYLLRLPDAQAKQQAYREFVADLRRARSMVDNA